MSGACAERPSRSAHVGVPHARSPDICLPLGAFQIPSISLLPGGMPCRGCCFFFYAKGQASATSSHSGQALVTDWMEIALNPRALGRGWGGGGGVDIFLSFYGSWGF